MTAYVVLVVLPFVYVGALVANIFDSAWGWLSGAVGDVIGEVKDLIRKAVSFAVDALVWVINNLIGIAAGILWTAIGWINLGLAWVGGIVGWLAQHVEDLFQYALGAIGGAIDWLLSQIGNAVAWLLAQIGAAINWAQAQLDAATNWLISDVINPVISFAQGVWQFVTVDVPRFVESQINNVWCYISDTANNIYSTIGGITSFLDGVVTQVVDVALKAMTWLVWFAEHPFDWFTTMLHDAINAGSKQFIALADKAVRENFDDFLSNIAKWLT